MQIEVKLSQNPYKVYVDELENLSFDCKVAILTNPKISGLHLKNLLNKIKCKELFIISVKDGEEYKNLSTIEEILNQMFNSKLDRKSLLISFGGGVISDMGGFVASIYQRGIDFINIPTTLLACVDAAVGGKTGVNNAFGKNLIGSFYQPKAVYCQSEFLRTLPQIELSAGMAEFIKMAMVFDKSLLEFIESIDADAFLNAKIDDEILRKIIAKSVELKAKIVEKDEKEAGLRMLLNYGHTFAHIIENQTAYKQYLHGEAVAIGMNMANILALNLGFLQKSDCQRLEKILLKFKLPTTYKIQDINEFYNAFYLDKKSLNAKLNFIILKNLGKGIIKDDIDKSIILKCLEVFT
ncbi:MULTISPECIES: 3-dehydroquinate synthase [unclassified Campylobacter]|uniref:3-dehydroquinate synthase n=1 Tax=unclassified Campylobacter TaxID=2593542 RepID=UPI0012380D79|nr:MULTISPECIES: 3-dehydroquinate synthase [unclassified Campylobacter]KAA6226411.1 3-dehydroquinate synthase [Campylobacter sp. LR286c]KAA6226551.1 3-dehydroquinate synthase [Campylobacter sp. LR185c]KAA6226899.1 3-dehydroquinate synthase [Campylobacter sp. LR196d]KAA6233643.1 3-dehydroquinate synthase [Campylobacter sp. LR291e]KAA6233863.1 3-dehydroquinate synthase [Campylobacter sp. LR264d]